MKNLKYIHNAVLIWTEVTHHVFTDADILGRLLKDIEQEQHVSEVAD